VPAFQVVISPDVVDVLRHEHEQIRQLCADVQAGGRSRKTELFGALQRAVHRHLLGERMVAHPAARASGPTGDDIALASQAEGERLERSLAGLGRLGAGNAGFDSGFAALSGALHDHAARQESDEFPLLRLYVPTQRLHMMAGAMRDIQIMASD